MTERRWEAAQLGLGSRGGAPKSGMAAERPHFSCLPVFLSGVQGIKPTLLLGAGTRRRALRSLSWPRLATPVHEIMSLGFGLRGGESPGERRMPRWYTATRSKE